MFDVEQISVLLNIITELNDRIPIMARGWESKSIEQQQEEMAEQRQPKGVPLSKDEQKINRQIEGLRLCRERLAQQLLAATSPRHRQMLEQSIAELDRQLASFK